MLDQPAQLLGLPGQRGTCGIRFLDHRGILLRDLIHLVDGSVDLIEPDGLFPGGGGYGRICVLTTRMLLSMLRNDSPVSLTSFTPLFTSPEE